MNTIEAIPTSYNGVNFRSRLEARWAAFFDLMSWEWAYEPIDLRGYIPDFILRFYKPLLVEVKPELYLRELDKYIDKIEQSGWDKEILIVGADIFKSAWCSDYPCIGLLGEVCMSGERSFDEGSIFQCSKCNRKSIFHTIMSYACRVNGCHDGDHYLDHVVDGEIDKLWKEAGNIIQYRPKRDGNYW